MEIDDLPRQPFTAAQARDAGIGRGQIERAVRAGRLRAPVKGVYVASTIPDTLAHRAEVLRLVVPRDAVVVDESAAWLHGADVLEPGSHLVVPRVHVFQATPGRRLRNGLVCSGERRLAVTDTVVIHGLVVTTPLRTACDLGRLRHRDRALAGIDAMLRAGDLRVEHIVSELDRFKGHRGICQLRLLAPLGDRLSGSPGESALRLRWYDAGLPRPRLQVPVAGPDGASYYLDLGLQDDLFGAEYDGEQFHSGDADRERDHDRRAFVERHHGWSILVARRDNVYGHRQDATAQLRRRYAAWASRARAHIL